MKAKYKYGDIVSFKVNGEKMQGIVYIVDHNGTFEQSTYPSYDIMVNRMLYKHITEPCVSLVLASPFHNARYVFDEDFANRLLCLAENAKDNAVSGFADEMIEKAKILIEYQKLAKYGDL